MLVAKLFIGDAMCLFGRSMSAPDSSRYAPPTAAGICASIGSRDEVVSEGLAVIR